MQSQHSMVETLVHLPCIARMAEVLNGEPIHLATLQFVLQVLALVKEVQAAFKMGGCPGWRFDMINAPNRTMAAALSAYGTWDVVSHISNRRTKDRPIVDYPRLAMVSNDEMDDDILTVYADNPTVLLGLNVPERLAGTIIGAIANHPQIKLAVLSFEDSPPQVGLVESLIDNIFNLDGVHEAFKYDFGTEEEQVPVVVIRRIADFDLPDAGMRDEDGNLLPDQNTPEAPASSVTPESTVKEGDDAAIPF